MSITVTTRMYQVGELGDCFLIRFKNGQTETNVLIDCGSFRNGAASITRMQKIAAHIKKDLNGKKLDIVVGTHQHNDHVSGFVHAEATFNNLVDQVWLSWLDDPTETLAKRIKQEQKNLVSQLQQIYGHAEKLQLAGDHLTAVKDLLGFYSITAAKGDDPEIPAKGIGILKKIGANPVKYLSPGDQPELPRFSENQVKVYVMGPPRKRELLFDKDPKKNESFDPKLAFANISASRILSALAARSKGADRREEDQFPFNKSFKKTARQLDRQFMKDYNDPDDQWRQIDLEWLEQAEGLALYLDSFTNNSSLVLAFELVKSKKVLLFAADAQTGNWLSWNEISWKNAKPGFTTKSLLENTVLYKVGHHASHNATLKDSLLAMQHDELVAMIPVDAKDPNIDREKGWKMPAKNLYAALKKQTKFRVLRMDMGFADECDPVKNKATSKWKDLAHKPVFDTKNFFMEYTVSD
ncbi:MBL fold metallo-hydrolase [Flavihumibacter petaseus]|uniref:Metallo-beta-lactamase domain-containing protein n=1 Tax=Flavihumibacter petaseus NBRC 106054 TaxID=1220578 RepID=A0A0E9N673_9BACT|nr:MBL fold metallo-hydrolase [Flavihumibacter petaseus]GAO45422.1 hypothetical protein FPE01S_05_01170 [Flavihumibacter petaseus NBRC 106054]